MFLLKTNQPAKQIFRLKCTYTKIADLSENQLGQELNIKGWVKGKRSMKEHLFVDINDGSTFNNLQVIIKKGLYSYPGYGSSVDVYGTLQMSAQEKYELNVDQINVVGTCPVNQGFPFVAKQNHPQEYIREFLHMRSKVNLMNSIFRVRHHATSIFQNWLYKKKIIQIHTPILTTNICEGGGEVFRVQPECKKLLNEMRKANVSIDDAFFDKKAYLTVSGQLHLEAMCNGLGNCYTFNPAFRAENSKTPFHLAEFYMLEVEITFLNDIKQLTNFIEEMMKNVTKNLLEVCPEDITKIRSDKAYSFDWLNKSFPVITYSEALDILRRNSSAIRQPINESEGLTKDQEIFLTNYTNSPLFVIDWPAKMKPFYMKQKDHNPEMVDAFDFLVPVVGELAGGSIRESSYDRLHAKLPNGLQWYLDLRKFGGIPTGGFGLGFERYLQLILGVTNIKDLIPFPRWPHNCAM